MAPALSHITAYWGTTLPAVGSVLLQVWSRTFQCRLDCKLVDRSDIRPLLERKACISMKIVSYLDNDQLHKPNTGDAPVYTVEHPGPVSTEQLLEMHRTIFSKGVGLLDGKYHIRLDDRVHPMQYSPRQVPAPLQEALKHTLEDLTQQGIIAPA